MILAAFLLLAPKPAPKPAPLSLKTLLVAAHTLALDEGYPIEKPGYSFDTMRPLSADDGFDSIGLYLNRHLVRMYSIHRVSGDIVDFMHGCVVFQFANMQPLQRQIRRSSGGHAFTQAELMKQTGCPVLGVVNMRHIDQ
ncbi:hypothetical protein SAMN05421770_10371 [Granulicella rosea]|uniref:Uncharacterized protein n=1 Tax=Granulicella rosea TaxID=474952 RepID=A0A239IE76_9BACT|nr:hypothetical protein [Granulicella rosea]SNS91871.1 hypothetical protein SAMN05421770_10371 [Granulicella rosea]